MVTCPSCNTQNFDDATYCVGCGAPLASAPAQPQGSVACPSCGAENQAGNQFCVSCGAPLPAAPLAPTAAAPEPPAAMPAAAPAPGPAKDRSLALLLEILPACFGIFGLGWLYSGSTSPGLAWLIGMLVWEGIALAISLFTFGLFCLCFLPINLALVATSAYLLYNSLQQRPEFSA